MIIIIGQREYLLNHIVKVVFQSTSVFMGREEGVFHRLNQTLARPLSNKGFMKVFCRM